MGAARRFCVKAVVLTGMMSVIVSMALPACRFPEYGFTNGGGGSAGAFAGGMSNAPGGAPGDGGESGGNAGGGDAGGGNAGGGDAGEGNADGGNAGGGNAGGAGGAEPVRCPTQACVPGAPGGWVGPIAFWEGTAGVPSALPACPAGYASATDLNRALNAPPGACTCTCAAQGQVCDENTTLHIYTDMTCATPCATASPKTCDAVSGCTGSQGSLRADTPTPSGGSCQATVSAPVTATWQYSARLCLASDMGTCVDPSQVCAPTPGSPYASQVCVMSVVLEGHALPACPADYPNPNEPLYETFLDGRGCTACGCGSPTGGSCSGNLLLSGGGDCSGGVEYSLGSGCKQFNLGSGTIQPSHVGGQYTVVPGTCSVASAAHANGGIATPNGSVTVVCCR